MLDRAKEVADDTISEALKTALKRLIHLAYGLTSNRLERTRPGPPNHREECALSSPVDQIVGPSPDERQRIRAALYEVGAGQWNFSHQQILEVWLLEKRLEAERLASQRLARATWALAAVTVALVLATVALVIATFQL